MNNSYDLCRKTRLASLPTTLCALTLLLSACGGSSGTTPTEAETDPMVVVPQPDLIAATSTEDLINNASVNIGSSLDSSLDGVSRVTSGGDSSSNPENTGVGGLWSSDAQQLVDTSLDLGNEDNTTREGSQVTIDPDDNAVCSEELVGRSASDEEFQRCVALVSDMLVQLDASTDTAGSLTYLFQSQPLVMIDYTENSNSFELNVGTLKLLIDEDNALSPDGGSDSPLDTLAGAIRVSAVTTNTMVGSEAGSVAVEVSQPLTAASADAANSLSLGTGTILAMTVDAAAESAEIELDLGALAFSASDDGSVNSLNMNGLSATIALTGNADQLTVTNLGIGDGPLSFALDNAEVLNLGLDTFGFTLVADDSTGDEVITLTGGLNLRLLVNEILDDNTVSDTLFAMLEMSAPTGTQIIEQINGSTLVNAGGPFVYTETTTDDFGNPTVNEVVIEAGQCADESFDSELRIVSCQ